MNIVYGCVTNSLERLQRNVIPGIGDHTLIALWNQTSLASAYNHIMNACRNLYYDEPTEVDALILLHDDLEFLQPDAGERLAVAVQQLDVAIAGVIGGGDGSTLAWWGVNSVGYQLTDSGPIDFGGREGDVAFVDGSVMAFSSWAIDHLRFDESYEGFHGYDDICTLARTLGKRVIVTDVQTHHHTQVGWKSAEYHEAWCRAEQAYQEKWRTHETNTLQ